MPVVAVVEHIAWSARYTVRKNTNITSYFSPWFTHTKAPNSRLSFIHLGFATQHHFNTFSGMKIPIQFYWKKTLKRNLNYVKRNWQSNGFSLCRVVGSFVWYDWNAANVKRYRFASTFFPFICWQYVFAALQSLRFALTDASTLTLSAQHRPNNTLYVMRQIKWK